MMTLENLIREIRTLKKSAETFYAHVSVGALPSDAEYIHVVNDKLAEYEREYCDRVRAELIVPTPDNVILWTIYDEDGNTFVDWKAGVVCAWLDHMPFDRYDDERGFIHATGREYWDGCGWVCEYEDED